MFGITLQILTAVIGGTAIYLRAKPKYKLISCTLGLMSTPLWAVVYIYYHQWFLLPISILYLISWAENYKYVNGRK